MAVGDDPSEEIEFLARSSGRVELLELFAAQNPRTRTGIQQQSSATRTTVQRNLDALQTHGLIEHDPHTQEYELTLTGKLLTSAFLDLLETVDTLQTLEPILRWMPRTAFEFPFELSRLADATIVTPAPGDPYAPVSLHIDALKRSSHTRLLLPVMGLDALEIGRQKVEDTDTKLESVVHANIAAAFDENPTYQEQARLGMETGQFSIAVYDDTIPCYLGIFDDVVQLGVENDEGVPQGMIETDDEAVRAWAERTYAEYEHEATPYTFADE